MKKIYIGLLISALSTVVHAQSVKLEWAKSMGGTSVAIGNSIISDTSGNVLVTGIYQDTVDFDPGASTFNLISKGSSDVFIQKLDSNGNFIWAKSIGGTSSDVGKSISIDASENVLITGYYYLTVDFDPGAATFNLSSNGSADAFILKLDAGGNFIWAKSIGGTGSEISYSLTTDSSGNLYVTGSFQGTVDFDPGATVFNLTSNGNNDIFIQKLDAGGNFVWAKSIGGPFSDWGQSIIADAAGNIHVTGQYQDTVDFDPGAAIFNMTSMGGTDVFIQRFDANGNFIWAKSIGGTGDDYSNSITNDALGKPYVTGIYENTADFDPGAATFNLISNGGTDVFILKLDTAGNFIWVKSMGGTLYDGGVSITSDANGNVYVTGYYEGTVDFDPGAATFNLTSNGNLDLFVQKLDTGGNFIWVITVGGASGDDIGLSITTDVTGNLCVTGQYQDTVDFNPGVGTFNLISNGFLDVFVQKLSECIISTGIDTIITCDSIIWIDSNTYSSDNNTATYTLTDAAGCDSVVTLNLTIDTVDTSVTTTSPTITANSTGASYQWLDCDSNYAVITGETAQSFTASANGNYAVEVTKNGCSDTSVCINITNVAIEENTLFNSVTIFPNPNSGLVTIDLGFLREVSIKIFSASGQLIYKFENINTQIHQFEFNEAPGVYFVEVSSAGEKQQYKLVKK